jgi:putative colanic acid biosynthesis UDP-glucose lipid carrier transferase
VQRHTGRFSVYIRPFSYVLDLIIINVLAYNLLINSLNGFYYHLFVSFSWVVISWNVGFYEVYRFTKVTEILEKIIKQYAIFTIVNFAYIGYFLKFSEPSLIVKFISIAMILIAFEKLFIYYFL